MWHGDSEREASLSNPGRGQGRASPTPGSARIGSPSPGGGRWSSAPGDLTGHQQDPRVSEARRHPEDREDGGRAGARRGTWHFPSCARGCPGPRPLAEGAGGHCLALPGQQQPFLRNGHRRGTKNPRSQRGGLLLEVTWLTGHQAHGQPTGPHGEDTEQWSRQAGSPGPTEQSPCPARPRPPGSATHSSAPSSHHPPISDFWRPGLQVSARTQKGADLVAAGAQGDRHTSAFPTPSSTDLDASAVEALHPQPQGPSRPAGGCLNPSLNESRACPQSSWAVNSILRIWETRRQEEGIGGELLGSAVTVAGGGGWPATKSRTCPSAVEATSQQRQRDSSVRRGPSSFLATDHEDPGGRPGRGAGGETGSGSCVCGGGGSVKSPVP